jgi:diguanylate cyclase (GGDEF)-like protein/PAS domain S-box-containing protein
MKPHLLRAFEPVFLDDIQAKKRANTLRRLILLNLLICVAVAWLYAAYSVFSTRERVVIGLWAGAILLAYAILQRGRVVLAGVYFTLTNWLVLSYLAAYIHGELDSPLIATNLLIAVAAGLILGRAYGLVFVGLGILSVVAIYFAQQSGVLPEPAFPLTAARSLILHVLNFLMVGVVISYTTQVIREAMQRARLHEDELLEKNRELEAARASLELQVAQRTAEILEQKQYFEALMKNSPLAIAALDQNYRIVAINDAFERLFGYNLTEAIGAELDNLIATSETLAEAQEYTRRVRSGEQIYGAGKRKRKDGSLVDVEVYGMPVIVAGEQVGILGVYQDVSSRKQAEEQLQYMATHDLLTNLPNRFLYNDRLNQAVAKAKRSDRRFAVLFLDLDGFKEVNDRFGHQKGDGVLQQVAERLKGCLRGSDTLARLGGDEFSLILEDIQDAHSAAAVPQKLLSALVAPFYVDENEIIITASIGVSLYPDDGDATELLLKQADTAMYRAKELGGNKFVFSNPSLM